MAVLQPNGRGLRVGERLRMARQAKGLSTRAAAEKLKPHLEVSHATLASYERDLTRPPIDLMSALATLYDRPLNWFLGSGPSLSGVRYRNLKSKVGVRDRHQFEGECQRWIDAYIAIEQFLGEPLSATLSFRPLPEEAPAAVASRFRREILNLDNSEPLKSVVDILEQLGVRVMEAHTELSIDGMAARIDDEHVVFLKGSVTNDRARMNAAHELAHIILGDCGAEHDEDDEREAFEFASHLLLTNEMLAAAFKRKSVVDMVKFKERFGISLAAMVYRAKEQSIIRDAEAKFLWIEFSKRGWRSKEPGQVWSDRSYRFEALVDSALVEQRASLAELARVANVRESELKRRLAFATGCEEYDAEQEETDTSHQRLRIVR